MNIPKIIIDHFLILVVEIELERLEDYNEV